MGYAYVYAYVYIYSHSGGIHILDKMNELEKHQKAKITKAQCGRKQSTYREKSTHGMIKSKARHGGTGL